MPDGADSVMMVEDTEREGNEVKFFKSITPGSNVGKMGGDIKEGAVILKAGILVGCRESGRACLAGIIQSQGL